MNAHPAGTHSCGFFNKLDSAHSMRANRVRPGVTGSNWGATGINFAIKRRCRWALISHARRGGLSITSGKARTNVKTVPMIVKELKNALSF